MVSIYNITINLPAQLSRLSRARSCLLSAPTAAGRPVSRARPGAAPARTVDTVSPSSLDVQRHTACLAPQRIRRSTLLSLQGTACGACYACRLWLCCRPQPRGWACIFPVQPDLRLRCRAQQWHALCPTPTQAAFGRRCLLLLLLLRLEACACGADGGRGGPWSAPRRCAIRGRS